MPRCPKNLPKWLPELFDFIAEQEEQYSGAYANLMSLIEMYWDAFAAEHAPPAKPKGQTPRDPSKQLNTAIEKYKTAVSKARGAKSQKLVEDFKNTMQQLPPKLRDVILEESDNDASVSDDLEPEAFESQLCQYDIDDGDHSETNLPPEAFTQQISGQEHAPNNKSKLANQFRNKVSRYYDTFRSEVEKNEINEAHALVISVDQLYETTNQLLNVTCGL